MNMSHDAAGALTTNPGEQTTIIKTLMRMMRRLIVPMLTLFFLGFTLLYVGGAFIEFWKPILSDGDVIEGLIKGLHMIVVALVVHELTQIVYEEYDSFGHEASMVARIRRGIIRFVSVACTALVLESLILVIKYSQKDLAGFLLYPVAIIAAAALLLIALGVFTWLTHDAVVEEPACSKT